MLMTNYRVNGRETSLMKLVDPSLILAYRPGHELFLISKEGRPGDFIDGDMFTAISEGQALHLSLECLDYVMAETKLRTPHLRQHVREMTAILRECFPCSYQALKHRL